MTELEKEEALCDFFRNRIRKSDLRRKVELAAISANNNKGVKPMVAHYETLEVNGKQYDVFVNYEGNDPKDDPGKYFDVFDSDGCCINPDVTFLKPPIEQDIAAAIRRLNGSDEAYDYQRTEDAMDALSESMNPLDTLKSTVEWLQTGKVDGVGFDEQSIIDDLVEAITKAEGGE